MAMLRRRYGAHPLHLLAMVASFCLAGYAAVLLVGEDSKPILVVIWFVGAAVGHDLLLVPLYAIADRTLIRRAVRGARATKGPRHPRPGPSPWINYLRVPAMLSGLLLLVWLPSIARLSDIFTETTALSSGGYVFRWLAVTGVLFALSALVLAIRLRRGPPAGARPDTGPVA